MRFTTKTKKADLVAEVVRQSLMNKSDAEKKTRKELLDLIRNNFSQQLVEENKVQQNKNDETGKNEQKQRGHRIRSMKEQLDEISKYMSENTLQLELSEDVSSENDKDLSDDEKFEISARMEILASILEMKEKVDKSEAMVNKCKRRIAYIEGKAQSAYEIIGHYANKIASTYNERYFPLFDNLMSALWELGDIIKCPNIAVIDMRRIVQDRKDEIARKQKEQEEQRLAEENYLKEERSFINGIHICFENGEPCISSSCSDDDYSFYKEWFDFVKEWVIYVYNNFLMKSKPVKLNIKKELIMEFKEYGVGTDIIEMLEDIIREFCKDNDKERALAYFTAVIDSAFD